jgi:hypothetical protein
MKEVTARYEVTGHYEYVNINRSSPHGVKSNGLAKWHFPWLDKSRLETRNNPRQQDSETENRGEAEKKDP